jgi:hypothetical protein
MIPGTAVIVSGIDVELSLSLPPRSPSKTFHLPIIFFSGISMSMSGGLGLFDAVVSPDSIVEHDIAPC